MKPRLFTNQAQATCQLAHSTGASAPRSRGVFAPHIRIAGPAMATGILLSAAATHAAEETGAVAADAQVQAPQTAATAPKAAHIQETALPGQAEDDETVITVTATRNPQLVSETASTVTVISRQQLEARKIFDLSEALRMVPGVTVAQTGTRGKSASVFMRGTESNHTLVLIDGVRANNPDDGRFDLGDIPAENIDRIEVLRGPGSALYGSDAIGGVINIITRRGSGPVKTGGKVEIGNYATNKQVMSVNGQLGKSRLSLAAHRLASDGAFTNDRYRDNGVSLRLDRELAAGSDLTFLTRVSNTYVGVPGQQYLAADPFQSERMSNFNSSLQWNHRQGNRTDKVLLGVNDRDLRDDDTRDTQFGFPFFFTAHNRVTTAEAQSAWQLGSHTLTAGLESRREANDSTFVGDQKTRTNAVYLQDEWKVGKLQLVPGLRRERNSQYGGLTSGRLATAYSLTGSVRLKGTYGTAFKAPSFLDLYGFGGNANLRPEKSRGVEVGLEKQFSGGGRAEVTLFRNRIRDLIAYDNATSQSINVSNARTQGVEFTFDKPVGKNTRLVLGQAFTTISSSDSAALTRRPRYSTTADIITRRGKWNADLGFLAQGKRQDADFVNEFALRTYPSFNRVDLTVGYELKRGFEVYARAQNLLNRKYDEIAGYPAPRFNVVLGLKTLAF